MRRYTLLWLPILAMAVAFLVPRTAQAYIDPGTTGTIISGSVWGIIAPFMAMALAFIGFMIRPVRMYFSSMISKVLGRPPAEITEASDDHPTIDPPGDDERGGPR